MTGTPSKSAMALRAAFGDRKLPDISRKITACVACRKLKSLQMLLESDVSWKDKVEERLGILENAIARLTADNQGQDEIITQINSNHHLLQQSANPSQPSRSELVHEEEQQWEVIIDDNRAPDAVPASYVSEVSNPNFPYQVRESSSRQLDVISSGILPLQEASAFFEIYRARLDHFVYSILGDSRTLSAARTSPLLVDAICAVGALHSNSGQYSACRAAFMQQVSRQMFSKRHCADDVRGLIVGAFWLSDLSWALIGAAVRIATEINLHRSFVRPNYESREWYLNARLYLQVWTCDHHLSIVYGRSPMTESFRNLDFGKNFLSCEHACQDDSRLFSQVEIWMISYRTYKIFGIDNEAALTSNCLTDFRRIGIALDIWRADWDETLTFDEYLGNYPKKGSGLHYNFAELYLYSHAYRGLLNAQTNQLEGLSGLEEFAAKAITAADAILRVIISDEEIQSYLNGLPTYFGTMIAFAVVFLLKAVSKVPSGLRIHKDETLDLLDQTSATLVRLTNCMRKEHILSSVSKSVKKLVEKDMTTNFEGAVPRQQEAVGDHWGSSLEIDEFAWLMNSDNSIFVGNFDLTGPAYDIDFNFMDTSPVG